MADITIQSETAPGKRFSVPKFTAPRLHAPKLNRQSLGVTTHVDYSRYNPGNVDSTHGRKSLADLDYSPLRRVTWASFNMGILVSMGGFIFGYDTVSNVFNC